MSEIVGFGDGATGGVMVAVAMGGGRQACRGNFARVASGFCRQIS
jgi:hypothetical protein